MGFRRASWKIFIFGFLASASLGTLFSSRSQADESDIDRRPGILYEPSSFPQGPNAEDYFRVEQEFELSREASYLVPERPSFEEEDDGSRDH